MIIAQMGMLTSSLAVKQRRYFVLFFQLGCISHWQAKEKSANKREKPMWNVRVKRRDRELLNNLYLIGILLHQSDISKVSRRRDRELLSLFLIDILFHQSDIQGCATCGKLASSWRGPRGQRRCPQ